MTRNKDQAQAAAALKRKKSLKEPKKTLTKEEENEIIKKHVIANMKLDDFT